MRNLYYHLQLKIHTALIYSNLIQKIYLVFIDLEMRLRGVNMFYLGTREKGVDSFVYRNDMVVMVKHLDN